MVVKKETKVLSPKLNVVFQALFGLEKTIVILITNFKISNLEELEYHSTWKIMETKAKKKIILTNKLEIDIIELPKIMGKENNNDKLLDWLYFLENPECERVTKKMEENENLKEAVNRLNTLSEDEYLQRIADLREKAIRDEKAIYGRGIEIGEEQGLKKGIEQGIKKGIKKGKEQGIKEGRKREAKKQKEETARKMLKMGMDIETVIKITDLSKEEIQKIEKANNI